MSKPSIERLVQLQQLIADFAKIERVPPMADTGHLENDVEHSFGLALTCWYLQPKVAPELDLSKVLRYALAHDIIELHAGDTYAFDKEAIAEKDSRERESLEQIRLDWPDFADLTDHAEGYMNKSNEEAKFVKAVDKMLPVFMIELGLDHQDTWRERQVTLEMERENKVTMHVSEYISPYYQLLIDWLDDRNNIPKI